MILFKYYIDIPENFTGVCKATSTEVIYHMKDGKAHNENGPSIIYAPNYLGETMKYWYYKGEYYGYNDRFTNESWIQFIRNKKLEIFK